MMYGLLIGLIISGSLMFRLNWSVAHEINLAIARGYARMAGGTMAITAFCALIGLIIRGA